ncbi:hypothetical protein ACLGIH_14385 [Streptomyces sp. HMX87]|uniref:hypothetical protein n=1 Tax=Streptomyces sp. HMX87 TaxID=3390849 RepID=UPI003A895DA7
MTTASGTGTGHHGLVLVAIIMGGLVAVVALCAYLGSAVTRRRRHASTPVTRWRDLSLLCATAALALYVWGCLRIFLLYGKEGGEDCFTLDDLRSGVRLDEAAGDFVPLRLVCHMSDGRSVSIVVPDYVNPTIAVLLLLSLACGVTSALLHRKRHTTPLKAG